VPQGLIKLLEPDEISATLFDEPLTQSRKLILDSAPFNSLTLVKPARLVTS
jgi:hypothetical protein